MRKRILLGLAVCWLATGCQKRTLDEGNAASAKSEAGKSEEKVAERPKPVEHPSVEGNWLIEAGNRQRGAYGAIALIKIERKPDGTFGMRLLDPHPQFPELQLVGSLVDEAMVAGSFRSPSANRNAPPVRIAFRANKIDGDWRGLAQVGNDYVPTRLVGTNEDKVEKYLQPVPFEHGKEFERALKVLVAKNDPDPLKAVLRKYPRNPWSYFSLTSGIDPFREISRRPPEEVAPATIPTRKDLDDHLSLIDTIAPTWGVQAHLLLRLNFATLMQTFRIEPDLVERIVDGFEDEKYRKLRPSLPLIDIVQVAGKFESDLNMALNTKDEAKAAAAFKRLDERKDGFWRYQPMRLYALAEAGRRVGETESALINYARLLVLPGLLAAFRDDLRYRRITPVDVRKKFDELWKSSGRPDAEKQAFLNETYQSSIHGFLKDHAPDPGGYAQSPLLIELFTGSEAPRCAAIDVALAANQRTFLPKDLVVLRYHFPVPKFSPLGAPAGKVVSRQMGTREPPDILFNGLPWEVTINGRRQTVSLDGTMATYLKFYWQYSLHAREYRVSVTMLYNRLRTQIVALLAQPNSGYDLTLKADRNGDDLAIEAKVASPPDSKTEVRVRFALAEDHVHYTGANGIRRHDMVVRGVPGKVEGIKPDPMTGSVKTAINLKQLQEELRNYLEGLKRKGGEAKIDESLLEFRNLHLVGIVQDEQTNRVLAVKSIVVIGKATPLVDRHKFGAVFAVKPIDHSHFRAPPPPLPITPGKK